MRQREKERAQERMMDTPGPQMNAEKHRMLYFIFIHFLFLTEVISLFFLSWDAQAVRTPPLDVTAKQNKPPNPFTVSASTEAVITLQY